MNHGVVIKPWGREYLCYKNDNVAIWVLEIEKGKTTSLHCHPKKNTALILLQGVIELSLIRDTVPHRMHGLDKINIFRGRFHRTKAISDGVVLLEVEAPDNKRDIIRLDDEYGRVDEPIEDATLPRDDSCLWMNDVNSPFDSCPRHSLAGCLLRIFAPFDFYRSSDLLYRSGILVTLTGGLEHGLVPPGDAIDGATMTRFARKFKVVPKSTFLQIWKPLQ